MNKRDIWGDIYDGLLKLSKIIISAATIWIKSSCNTTTIADVALNMSKKLVNQLVTEGHKNYDNMYLVLIDLIREEISRVSLYAKNHPDVLEHAISSTKDLHQFIDYVTDEFIGAEILLAGVYKLLKIGKIDCQSLGELTQNEFIMNLNSALTTVKEVINLPEEQAVKFIFDIIQDIPFANRIIKSDILIIFIATAVILILIFIAYTLIKQSRNNLCEPAITHHVIDQTLVNFIRE